MISKLIFKIMKFPKILKKMISKLIFKIMK